MHGPGTALVSGVERGHELAHLGPATLPHDDPVRAHPERLAQQPREVDRAAALGVGLSGLECDDVRMVDAELGDVLDRDDALVVRDGGEHGGEEGRLPAAGGTTDEDVPSFGDRPFDHAARDPLEGPAPFEPGEGRPPRPREPDRERRAGDRDRREHDVHADPVLVADVGHRRALVDVPATAGDEGGAEFTGASFVEDEVDRFQPGAAVDPRPAPADGEDVGDRGVPDEAGELLELGRAHGPLRAGRGDPGEERRGRDGSVSVHVGRR